MDIKDLINKEIEKNKKLKLEKINIIIDQIESLKHSIYEVKHDIQSIYVNVDIYNTLYELECIQNIDNNIEKLEEELKKWKKYL